MVNCRRYGALLPRAMDDEIGAGESLKLARHLHDCTSCRILEARERRLAMMLDAFEDALPVDAGFTEGVMAALPEAPPEAPAGHLAHLRRRGLKLVALAGLIGFGAGLFPGTSAIRTGPSALPGLPRFSLEGMESIPEALGGFVRLILLTVSRVRSGAGLEIPFLSGATGFGYAALLPLFLTLLMFSMVIALATGRLRRRPGAAATRPVQEP